jgi:hypothetical protein
MQGALRGARRSLGVPLVQKQALFETLNRTPICSDARPPESTPHSFMTRLERLDDENDQLGEEVRAEEHALRTLAHQKEQNAIRLEQMQRQHQSAECAFEPQD